VPYIRTQMGTDTSAPDDLASRLLSSIDSANPTYRRRRHLVRWWVIEFDEAGSPWREIGLAADGSIVFAGPSANDYGFWLDTDMKYADFSGDPVTREYFEALWAASGVVSP
jgi:hypothetical protein